MLSNPTSSIQKRRQLHRRQNSTPTIFEAPHLRPLPVIAQRQSAHRRGMSLDQKPQHFMSPFSGEPQHMPAGLMSQEDGSSMVSITNPGQTQQQHTLQVAQTHRLAQPGPQFQHFQDNSVHDQNTNNFTSQDANPSHQQLKELEQHIRSVYGEHATVQVNILPSPIATPQKSSPMVPLDHLDMAPMPSSLSDAASINLEPPTEDHPFNYNFDNPESEMGYESSYYSSSPCRSPSGSPQSRSIGTFEVAGRLAPPPRLSFSRGPALMPAFHSMHDYENSASPTRSPFSSPLAQVISSRADSIADLSLDATIEDTGISPEEIQQYISEQDPVNHRWTCLYTGCDKTFGRRENIRSHVQTHLGDRQFRCNHCDKCFVRQHDLKRHAKIHTGDKPYKCPCSAGFARQDALTRHRQRGMCDGAFPNAVRRQVRRGRPRKKRPDLEERLDKSHRTRAAMTYASSSSSGAGESPASSAFSHQENGDFNAQSQFTDLHSLQTHSNNTSDPFSFQNTSSHFDTSSPPKHVADTHNHATDIDAATANLMRFTSEAFNQTPPLSPVSPASSPPGPLRSTSNAPAAHLSSSLDNFALHIPKKARSKTPDKRSFSNQSSNPFTTPPTSPGGPGARLFEDEGDFQVGRGYDDGVGVGADFTMFGDALGEAGHGFSADDAMGASMAWIDSL